MLYIKKGPAGAHSEAVNPWIEWHIGDPNPFRMLGRVVTFQADGDELDLIAETIVKFSKSDAVTIDVLPIKNLPAGTRKRLPAGKKEKK